MSFPAHPTLLTALALLETQSRHTWEFQSEKKGSFCKPPAAFSNLSPLLWPPKNLGPHFAVYLISLFERGHSLLLQGPRGLSWRAEEAVLTATAPKSSVKLGYPLLYPGPAPPSGRWVALGTNAFSKPNFSHCPVEDLLEQHCCFSKLLRLITSAHTSFGSRQLFSVKILWLKFNDLLRKIKKNLLSQKQMKKMIHGCLSKSSLLPFTGLCGPLLFLTKRSWC